MEKLSPLLTLCEGNPSVTGRRFWYFFVVITNKLLKKTMELSVVWRAVKLQQQISAYTGESFNEKFYPPRQWHYFIDAIVLLTSKAEILQIKTVSMHVTMTSWNGNFDVFFDLHLNKWLSKQSLRWWFERPSHTLRRHCDVPIQPHD